MHGDQDGGRRAERGQGEKAELRRAIDHDDVVGVADLGERLADAGERTAVSP